uniref:Uncharacterized protein n=1 Tax=Aegilops tauschii subsp. strangulata TaxID=200361 RepID=A0A452XT40_AEGTS
MKFINGDLATKPILATAALSPALTSPYIYIYQWVLPCKLAHPSVPS